MFPGDIEIEHCREIVCTNKYDFLKFVKLINLIKVLLIG